MNCARCGIQTPRLTLRQTRCPDCERDVTQRTAPRPEPAFAPVWMRRLTARDETGRVIGSAA